MPLSIWPGLPAPDIRNGLPCGGPITAAAARQIIGAFSIPGDLVASVAARAAPERGDLCGYAHGRLG